MVLFASRLSAKVPQYTAWKPDPYSEGTDAMQQIWSSQYLYTVRCLINGVVKLNGGGCRRFLLNLINRGGVKINGVGVGISNSPLMLVTNEKRDINVQY